MPSENVEVDSENAEGVRNDSKVSWMIRGLVFGAMLVGAANALSFFVRSKGWGGLLGERNPQDEAIGFPLMIWEEAGGYGAHSLQVVPFVLCILQAAIGAISLTSWIIYTECKAIARDRIATSGE